MTDMRGKNRGAIRHFSDLIVWQKSYGLGLKVFAASKSWPKEEKYALTDQIRRSARSVGAISENELKETTGLLGEVGRMLGSMMAKPGPFLLSREKAPSDL